MAEMYPVLNPNARGKTEPKPSDGCIGRPRWRDEAEQQIYSSKLVVALRRLHPAAEVSRAVREAADCALAATARGRTRWSRAILAGRIRLRRANVNRRHRRALAQRPAVAAVRAKTPEVKKELPPVQRRVKVLSGLVPGCRKVSLPDLLEETADYMAALEMQVKAMTFIASLLNNGGGEGDDSSVAFRYEQ